MNNKLLTKSIWRGAMNTFWQDKIARLPRVGGYKHI
jgi:hypothetical protein